MVKINPHSPASNINLENPNIPVLKQDLKKKIDTLTTLISQSLNNPDQMDCLALSKAIINLSKSIQTINTAPSSLEAMQNLQESANILKIILEGPIYV